MTTTTPHTDWMEKLWNLIYAWQEADAKDMRARSDAVEEHIKQTLASQKEELRGEIEKMRRPAYMVGSAPGDEAVGSEQRAFGANSVLDAVLSLLTPKTD